MPVCGLVPPMYLPVCGLVAPVYLPIFGFVSKMYLPVYGVDSQWYTPLVVSLAPTPLFITGLFSNCSNPRLYPVSACKDNNKIPISIFCMFLPASKNIPTIFHFAHFQPKHHFCCHPFLSLCRYFCKHIQSQCTSIFHCSRLIPFPTPVRSHSL